MPRGHSPFIHRGPHVSLEERFWAKVDKHGPVIYPDLTPCWLWLAAKSGFGYGQLNLSGKTRSAHRVAWFLVNGEWPEKPLAHRCDNPPCVNPDHLWEATLAENNHDMFRKGRGQKTTHYLTDAQCDEIRQRMVDAPWGMGKQLAREYGVTETWISQIAHGRHRIITTSGKITVPPLANRKFVIHDGQVLTLAQRREIAEKAKDGERGIGRDLAKEYGVSSATISRIRHGIQRTS